MRVLMEALRQIAVARERCVNGSVQPRCPRHHADVVLRPRGAGLGDHAGHEDADLLEVQLQVHAEHLHRVLPLVIAVGEAE